MKTLVWRFLEDQSGATSIEYAVIASMLSIVIVAAAQSLGTKLKGTFTAVQTAIN